MNIRYPLRGSLSNTYGQSVVSQLAACPDTLPTDVRQVGY